MIRCLEKVEEVLEPLPQRAWRQELFLPKLKICDRRLPFDLDQDSPSIAEVRHRF